MSTAIDDGENLWNNFKSFFSPQNSMLIIAIICFLFFIITLCLVFIIIQLLKKKRFYKTRAQSRTQANQLSSTCPKLEQHRNFPLTPTQTGLTSNQISSLGTIITTNKNIEAQESSPTAHMSISAQENNKTKSFDNFESELKRTCHEKGIASSHSTNVPPSSNDDEIETVNEVLGMEERNGKVYYKVNFTGHPPDYIAWVCEEDLIPE